MWRQAKLQTPRASHQITRLAATFDSSLTKLTRLSVVVLGVLCVASNAIAQDWLRPSGLWPSNSLIVRGQEPDAGEQAVAGREEDHIETDRDSLTPSSKTVGAGQVLIESSYSFIDNRDSKETHSLPELLIRIGWTDWLELRFGGNYEVGGERADVSGGAVSDDFEKGGLVRESQLLYGLKLRLSEQSDWIPKSSLIVQGHTPTSGPDPATAFTLGYVIGWELPDEWQLDSAIRYGADKEGDDRFEQWTPSIVLRKTLAERWNVHGEYFGHFSQDRRDNFQKHFFSPGVHYLITPNIEVGVRVGWGLNDQASRFFSNAGIGWRF